VKEAIAHGVAQVVILGAGLDTRAARLSAKGVRFFEVDHPASQAAKLDALRKLAGYPIDAATYVTCDFEREDFLDRLAGTGFDRARAAFFVWEGVVMYLTEPAVRATLVRVATGCAEQSAIVFDYLSKRFAEGRTKLDQDHQQRIFLDELGEPIIFGINDPVQLLFETGFRRVRVDSFDEACLELTGTYDRARLFRFAQLALATVTRRP
jgi:methyltransferase (TIGR00027 family)